MWGISSTKCRQWDILPYVGFFSDIAGANTDKGPNRLVLSIRHPTPQPLFMCWCNMPIMLVYSTK